MLVLTGKSGSTTRIGEANVTIKIVGNKYKLIIDAPKEVRVVRGELTLKEGERVA